MHRFLTASGCVSLLWASWDACHIGPVVRETLQKLAESLVAIPHVGLELRLGTDAGQVDLHQLVTRSDHAEIRRFLENRSAVPGCEGAANRLRAFLGAWAGGHAFGTVFEDIYLEYDCPATAGGDDAPFARPIPAVFLNVHARSSDPQARIAREALIIEAISWLQGPIDTGVSARLRRCFDAVAGSGSIGHIGVMLGRGRQAIRVNVKDLAGDALLPLLETIGWPGDRTAAQDSFIRLLDEVDLVTVALDLAEDWLPSLGLEAFIERRHSDDPRWRRLIDRFHTEALCTAEQRDALLTLPTTIVPGPSSPTWPASWAIAAALAPLDHIPSFRCALSHLKLTLDAAGRRSAKAYLGLHHEWLRPRVPSATAAEAARSLPEPSAARRTDAIERALNFVASKRRQGAFWRDFDLSIGESDEWVTAFIGCQLILAGQPRGRALAAEAMGWLLRRQRSEGGWGYNAIGPADADSTAWVLHLARGLQPGAPALARAGEFLRKHLLPDGGIATYAAATPIRVDGRLLSQPEAAGWRLAHDCVLANAAPLCGPNALAQLRRQQRPDGAWTAYWWRNDVFATAMAVESLDPVGDADRIARARAWGQALDPGELSAFDLAWAIRLELSGAGCGAVTPVEAVSRLLQLQDDDGSWPAGAPLVHQHPWETERGEAGLLALDQERCFTTASALAALTLVRPT